MKLEKEEAGEWTEASVLKLAGMILQGSKVEGLKRVRQPGWNVSQHMCTADIAAV